MANSKDMLFGKWVFKPRQSRFSSGKGPKEHIRVYEPVGTGYKLTVTGVDENGRKISWHYTGKYDGKACRVFGSIEVDSIALTRVDKNVTFGSFMKKRKVVAFYKRERTMLGGKEVLVITTAGVKDEKGKPYFDVTVYGKQ